MARQKPIGICKLTGETGPFVRSHLIPAALTRLSRRGEKLVETGVGLPVTRPSSSWYDDRLVTRKGEDVLEKIDTRGIELVRAHGLVWSGQKIAPDDVVNLGASSDGDQFRLLPLGRANELRLFFLSLMWRAAATARPQFESIALPEAVKEDLRVRLLCGDPGPPTDYLIQLFQIAGHGAAHNRAPLLERKELPAIGGLPPFAAGYVRLYFDGLVAHVHLPHQNLPAPYLLSCLGVHDGTIVFVHKFIESRAAANISEMLLSHLKR